MFSEVPMLISAERHELAFRILSASPADVGIYAIGIYYWLFRTEAVPQNNSATSMILLRK